MTLTTTRKGPRTNTTGKVSTSAWLDPTLKRAFEHRLIDLDLNFSEGVEEAMRQFLAPPPVILKEVLPTRQQRMIDTLIDMSRHPRNPTERKFIEWVEMTMDGREKS